MDKPIRLIGVALCSLSITLAGEAFATTEGALSYPGEREEVRSCEEYDHEDDCQLFFLKSDLGIREASLDAGEPVNTMRLFITGKEGNLIQNAQVVMTISNGAGEHHLDRAYPFKGGYALVIDHLPAGPYLVETEILTPGEFLTKTFRFQKA